MEMEIESLDQQFNEIVLQGKLVESLQKPKKMNNKKNTCEKPKKDGCNIKIPQLQKKQIENTNNETRKVQEMVNELKQMKNLGKKDYNEKLITLFKEKNKNLMNQIEENLEFKLIQEFAEQAVLQNLNGQSLTQDGKIRSLGGTYIQFVKSYLRDEDDMKYQTIFSRPIHQKQLRNQKLKQKRQVKSLFQSHPTPQVSKPEQKNEERLFINTKREENRENTNNNNKQKLFNEKRVFLMNQNDTFR